VCSLLWREGARIASRSLGALLGASLLGGLARVVGVSLPDCLPWIFQPELQVWNPRDSVAYHWWGLVRMEIPAGQCCAPWD